MEKGKKTIKNVASALKSGEFNNFMRRRLKS